MVNPVHVVAARNADRDDFDQFAQRHYCQAQHEGGWSWFRTTLEKMAISERLDQVLASVPGPAFRFSTVDGYSWQVVAFKGGERVFEAEHHFQLLDPGIWPAVEDDYEGKLKDFAVAYEIPRDIQTHLDGLSFVEALKRWLQLGAGQIGDMLATLEVPHERDEVLEILSGRDISIVELAAWEVGNLPRFLEAIGLTEVFPNWREEIDEAMEDFFQIDEVVDDEIDPLDWISEDQLEPLDEAVPLRVDRLAHLFYIPWFLNPEVVVTVVATPPAEDEFELEWNVRAEDEEVFVDCEDGVFTVSFDCGSIETTRKWLRRLGEQLKKMPDESELQLFATAEEQWFAGNQRYRGVLRQGTWQISEAFPPVDSKSLKEALQLSQQIDQKGPFVAESEAEAEAIQAVAESEDCWYLPQPPERDGLLLSVSQKLRPYLAMLIFRQRFREIWDVEQAEKFEDEGDDDAEQELDGVEMSLEEMLVVPHSDKVIVEGHASRFFEADILKLPKSEGSDLLKSILQDIYGEEGASDDSGEASLSFEEADAEMAALGFRHVGDMVCEGFAQEMICGYVKDESDICGVLRATTVSLEVEFYTLFANGCSLTTTTDAEVRKRPKKGIYYQSRPDHGVGELFDAHRDGVRRFCGKKDTDPLAAPATLVDLAWGIDEFLTRLGE